MEPPLRFGHYEALQDADGKTIELGRGNMGITYKAFDPSLHRMVALKVINFENLPGVSARERFLREARSAARMSHPNVATVFQLGEEGSTFFYAMEFIEGENLEEFIKREGALPCGLALRIVRQVGAALSAIHAADIVHRDIKPPNLMIVRDACGEVTVKVIDFGLAKDIGPRNETDRTLQTTGFLGTIHFASPEQIEGGKMDIRSDIYSLGATLWHLLTGRTLFEGSVARVIFHQVHEPPPLDRLAAPLEIHELLETMLAKEPDERPQSPAALLDLIERAEHAVAPEYVCKLSDSDGTTPITVALQSILRIRRALPLEEVIPVLKRIATAVEPGWQTDAGKLDFRLNGIRVDLASAHGINVQELMRRSICAWPDFSVNVPRVPTETQGNDGRTIQAPAPFIPSKNCVPVLARIAYELLGGDLGRLVGDVKELSPLAALTDEGNQVLQHALSDTRAKVFGTAQEFCTAIESANRERVGLKMRGIARAVEAPIGSENTLKKPNKSGEAAESNPPSLVIQVASAWFERFRWGRVAGIGSLTVVAVGAFLISRHLVAPLFYGNAKPIPVPEPSSKAIGLGPAELVIASPFENSLGMQFISVPIAGNTQGPAVFFARSETTVEQYAAFLSATGGTLVPPEFSQDKDHPVVNVTWNDAVAFCAWLTATELSAKRIPSGTRYRLPSDHEWSCAVGIGDREDAARSPTEKNGTVQGIYPWGSVWPPPPHAGNYADASAGNAGSAPVVIKGYEDGFSHTCPVDTFPPNSLGIYGLGGNAAEWCEDLFNPENQDDRTVRGACWFNCDESYLLSSFRGSSDPAQKFAGYSFRCVLEVPGKP